MQALLVVKKKEDDHVRVVRKAVEGAAINVVTAVEVKAVEEAKAPNEAAVLVVAVALAVAAAAAAVQIEFQRN